MVSWTSVNYTSQSCRTIDHEIHDRLQLLNLWFLVLQSLVNASLIMQIIWAKTKQTVFLDKYSHRLQKKLGNPLNRNHHLLTIQPHSKLKNVWRWERFTSKPQQNICCFYLLLLILWLTFALVNTTLNLIGSCTKRLQHRFFIPGWSNGSK